jgi:membrane protein DedA with SNARE-associated domain
MFSNIVEIATEFFLNLGEKYGYFAVFIGALADSLIPIVPSELIFGAAGFWVYKGYINLPLTIFIAVLGNLLASALFWYLGKRYGHGFLLYSGKYLGFNDKDLAKAESVFAKWGYWSVFFCQFIPLFRSIISIPSGVLELKFKKFIFATALGATVWSTALIVTAYNLGENWTKIDESIKTYGKPLFYIALTVFVTLIGYYLCKRFLIKRSPNSKQ